MTHDHKPSHDHGATAGGAATKPDAAGKRTLTQDLPMIAPV